MAQEPILWVRPGNYKPPQFTRTNDEGEVIVEKYPATAKPPEDHPLFGKRVQRWDLMVDHCGNQVRTVYTGGAADYGVGHQNYGAPLKRRHRMLGWFPLGECPLRLVLAGELAANHVSKSLRGKPPCGPGTHSAGRPCEHALAEEQARKDRNTRVQAKIADKYKSESEKLQRAALEAQGKSNDNLTSVVENLAKTVAALVGGGGWPAKRPNMTEEEYRAELEQRAKDKIAESAASEPVADDDELSRLMMEAEAEAEAEIVADEETNEPAPKGRGKKAK